MFSVRPYQVMPFPLLHLPSTLTTHYCGKSSLLSLILGPVPLPPPGGAAGLSPCPRWVILLCHPCAGGGERSSGGADCSFPHVTHEAWVVMGDNMWLWDILGHLLSLLPRQSPVCILFCVREGGHCSVTCVGLRSS